MDNELLQSEIENALALQQNNEVAQAKIVFEKILSEHPNQPDALHGLGIIYAQQRNFPKAINLFKQAILQRSDIPPFHNNLANALKALGKLDEALIHYREALRLKPFYPEAHNNLGNLLYKLGKYEEALDHFQKAIRMDPFNIDTHYNIANTYIQLDRYLDASSHYQEVLNSKPSHLGALHNLGITFCMLKRYQDAQPLLVQVIEREPQNLDALFHLGVVYSALANANEARACYEKVLQYNPQHAQSHHNLATIYLHLNQPDQALYHYQEALRLEPLNKTAQHMIDALQQKTQSEGAPVEYTRALFDQYAYSYDEQVKNKLHYQVPYLLRTAITPFLPATPHPLNTADLGCGTGLCAPFFADIVGKLIGVDVSPNMIEVARRRGGYDKLVVMDILSFLEKNNNEFDLIISADVLVYFGSLDPLFDLCAKALVANGLFCFSIESLIEENKDYQLRTTGRYAHNAQYIHSLCKKHNFTIKSEQEHTIRQQEEEPVKGTIFVVSH